MFALWFCRWFRRFVINIVWNLMHFRRPHVRANKLDVQETDFSFSQFNGGWNNFSWCRFTDWRYPSSGSLEFGYRSVLFFTKPNQQSQTCKRATEKPVGKHSTKHAKTNSNHAHQSRSDQYWSRSIKQNTIWFQCYVVCLWGHWSRDEEDNKRSKSHNETCVQNPQRWFRLIF